MKRLAATLGCLSVLALAGCNVVQVTKPIEEGEKVRLDPCAILTRADAEQILGAPVIAGSLIAGSDDLEDWKNGPLQCLYRRADGPDYGEHVQILIGAATRSTLYRAIRRSEVESLPIGKSAEFASGTNDLTVAVLTKEGVGYRIVAASTGRDPAAMLESIKKVSPIVMNRIEEKFGTTFTPTALTPPPVDLCELLNAPEARRVIGAAQLSTRARSESGLEPDEEDGYTHSEELFGGRWGGEWSCMLFFATDPEDESLQSEATIRISKGSVTVEDMKGLQGDAVMIPRLGAHAYWVGQDRSVGRTTHNFAWHNRNWLSVLTSAGSRFEIELVLHGPGTKGEQHLSPDRHKEVSIELAKLVIGKLP